MWVSIRLNDEQGDWENLELVPLEWSATTNALMFTDGAYGSYAYLTQNEDCEYEDSLFAKWEIAFLKCAAQCENSNDVFTFQFPSPITNGVDTYFIRAVNKPY